ncbi:universal stress protein [Nocardioides sp. LHG3406-4]|uniref:universal stress protein n=1 Tax=Nocardioides sp. LHG3406-4 TaxID=2804575 RepID=UPI003CF8DF49
MIDIQNRGHHGAVAVAPVSGSSRRRPRGAVVVGVDGSARNRAAVAWAVHEAASTARSLTLVSVLGDYEVPIPHHSVGTDEDRDWKMLRRLASDIARDRPELTVCHEMDADGTVTALLARSVDQGLLVVGKRGLGTFARALIGSTSIAVAGRSRVPVVVVPDSWAGIRHGHQPVVVGLDPNDEHSEALAYAFTAARRRGVTLVVAHGWETQPMLVRSTSATCVDAAYWKEHGLRRVSDAVAALRAEFDDVRVELVHRRGHPATVLLELAEDAQLLVVGRHDDGRLGGFAFGSVTRSVLHHAEVPVAVVPSASLRRPR